MPNHPLAEVFGFPIDNLTDGAERYRKYKLCPYHNRVPNCTKSKAKDPLGVCSVFDGDTVTITCPIRFRENWIVIEDAARFLFPEGATWTSLAEVRLYDADGKSAGNIDFVLVVYDDHGRVMDFGSLEVQGVYISGNVREPFEHYMADRSKRKDMVWTSTSVRTDYLSSSRKRLVPQMIFKGSIFKAWGKKQAVALHENFYDTLPTLPTVEPHQADIAWMIYGLELDTGTNLYHITLRKTVYTLFEPALSEITTPKVGSMDKFIRRLQRKLTKQSTPPDAPLLSDLRK